MNLNELAAAIFIGNIMTVSVVMSVVRFAKSAPYPRSAYLGIAVPILLALGQVWIHNGPPPFLH